jgi:mRNA interferase RelE/StbE
VTYVAKLSARAARDLDRLDDAVCRRILDRIEEIARNPFDPRTSARLTNAGGLRKSRVGGWRIIFTTDDDRHEITVVTVERRGQVYKRL